MKNIYITLTLLLFCGAVHAQKTVEVKQSLYNDITEKYQVLADSPLVKHGLYQAIYKRKTAVASGQYKMGKRAGTWHFYNTAGKPVQHFNYDTHTVVYEAPEDTSAAMRYIIDKDFTETDTITKPLKPGGVYFGYQPYLQQFVMPDDLIGANLNLFYVVVELLVSPGGRLADYKIRVLSTLYNYNKVADMDMKALTDDDKTFIPATVNGKPVTSSVLITCRIAGRHEIVPAPVAD